MRIWSFYIHAPCATLFPVGRTDNLNPVPVTKSEIKQMKNIAATPFLAAALAAASPLFAETPDRFVRYVESTGSQYVNTGVEGRWNTKVEAQVEWLEFKDSSLIGSRTSNSSPNANSRLYLCYTYRHGSESSYNVIYTATNGVLDEVYYNSAAARWEANRIYDYSATLSATNGVGQTTTTINVDGLEIFNKSAPALDTGRTLHLFACNVAGTANYFSKARIYRLKIWQGPIDGGDMALVRDLIPCMKNGRAGLWDAVSGDILYSGSSANLVCDEDSEVPDEFVEYVESTGVNFIDTEVDARSGTVAEIDLATLHNRTLRRGILGAVSGGGDYFDLFHSYEAKIACSYGTRLSTGGSYATGDRYHVVSSLSAGSQTLTMARDGSATTNTVFSATDAAAIDTGLSLYLFGRNANGNVADCGLYRLYGLKIRQDGALVRDFRPCLKDGAFALYDDVSGRIFYPKRGLLNGPVQPIPVKAKELIFVDYIESDGTQTLDTGVRARYGTRAKGDFAWAETLRTKANEVNTYLEAPIFRNARAYLGADDPTYWPSYFYMMYVEDRSVWCAYGNGLGNISVAYGATAYSGSTTVSMSTAGTKYSFDASFMDGEQTIELDGTQVWSLSNDRNYDTGRNLHIFSSGSRYRSAARCYGLEIWQDGALVRDFKPCIYQGKAMLYDAVSKCVFRPSPDIPASKVGSILFSGEEKPMNYVDYVESDGTIFVDTGVVGKSGTAAALSLMFKEKADKGFLDARKGDSRFYLIHNGANNNVFYIGYGKAQSFNPCAVNTLYNIQSELSVGRQEVTVNGTRKWTTGQSTTYIDPQDHIDTGLNLYVFAMDQDGTPTYPGAARLYCLRLSQGNADGSDKALVRNFRPVRLSNGLVALWDFVEKRPYLPQLVSTPGTYVPFPVVGPDGEKVTAPFTLIIR